MVREESEGRENGGAQAQAGNRKWFDEYKSQLRCERCLETHPACLEFHHREPKKKEIVVSKALDWGWSIERILTEIAKCDVVCANCHRKLHWK